MKIDEEYTQTNTQREWGEEKIGGGREKEKDKEEKLGVREKGRGVYFGWERRRKIVGDRNRKGGEGGGIGGWSEDNDKGESGDEGEGDGQERLGGMKGEEEGDREKHMCVCVCRERERERERERGKWIMIHSTGRAGGKKLIVWGKGTRYASI